MEEPVHLIRETSRHLLKLNRRSNRDEQSDNRRSLPIIRITKQSLAEITNKMKTKSSISAAELQTLKNGLLDQSEHVEMFLNVHGALRGLARELSGNDVTKKCAAAGCCCNLACDAKGGLVVAKNVGPYLIAALDNMSKELSVTCAWAVGNLAGCGPEVCEVLAAQGAVAKLTELLSVSDDEVQDAGVYAVTHFAYHMKDEFRQEHLTRILDPLSKLNLSMTSQLLFILSCHRQFSLPHHLFHYILTYLTESIPAHVAGCAPTDNCCSVEHLVRCLANVNVDDNFYTVMTQFLFNDWLKSVLGKEDGLSRSMCWLLGNLYNFNNDNQLFYVMR